MKALFVTIVLGALSLPAFAANEAGLRDHLAKKIVAADQAFQDACQPGNHEGPDLPPPEGACGGIEFKQFFLGLGATASFGVSDVLDLDVSPEVTFVWEKSQVE